MRISKVKATLCLIFVSFLFVVEGTGQVRLDENIKQRWQPEKNLLYKNNYVQVIVGDMPLVISVPHGGFMRPKAIPKRACKVKGQGTTVTVADSKTIETVRAIEDAFVKKYNKRPFIVISNLARTQVDQNRPIELAACDEPLAEQAWEDFHNAIDTALALAVDKFGKSLYIDFHGHGHKNRRLELGYSLNGPQLRRAADDEEKRIAYGAKSSMQNYLKAHKDETFENLLWGKNAFGTIIQKQGIPATPSMQDPYPVKGEKFFSGGYNTRRYTSSKYPKVFGWQIESNYKGVRKSDEEQATFAKAFVKAYKKFMKKMTR